MLPTELGNSTRICPKGHGGPNSSQSGEGKTEKQRKVHTWNPRRSARKFNTSGDKV